MICQCNLREQASILNHFSVAAVCGMNTNSHHNLLVARVRSPSKVNLRGFLLWKTFTKHNLWETISVSNITFTMIIHVSKRVFEFEKNYAVFEYMMFRKYNFICAIVSWALSGIHWCWDRGIGQLQNILCKPARQFNLPPAISASHIDRLLSPVEGCI